MYDGLAGSSRGHHVIKGIVLIASTAWLVLELILLFFGVAFVIQLFQRRLGPERLRAWMGGSPVVSALKGIAIGFVTPFCTYSAIPMLLGLRQAGVPPAGYVAFITAAPVLDPVLFGALVLIVGPAAAVLYAAIAFTGAMTLALIAQRVGIESQLKPDTSVAQQVTATAVPIVATAGTGTFGGPSVQVDKAAHQEPEPLPAACGVGDHPWQGIRSEIPPAATRAFALLRSVALLLMIGVAIGLLIEALVTPDDVARLTGNQDGLAIPIAAALGTPLYFHTSLFVPIADALSDAGVGIGAIVALTISGAGANVPEFIILGKLAKRRLITIFFGYVFSVALVGGLLAQLILG